MKTNIKLLLIIFTVISLSHDIFAQPEVDMVCIYNFGRREMFYDIYAVSDDGYIMCGTSMDDPDSTADMLMVRIDEDGDEMWSGIYGVRNVRDYAKSVVETDSGDFLAGGEIDPLIAAILVDQDGEEIWLETYREGGCNAVIELKSGEFMLAGGSDAHGYLACIEYDGDLIWDEIYGEQVSSFRTMRETNDGIVVAGRSNRDVWVVKVDFNGEVIWSSIYNQVGSYWCEGMVSVPNEGFALAGTANPTGRNLDYFFMKIDDRGDLEVSNTYEFDQRYVTEDCMYLARTQHGNFILAGCSANERDHRASVICVTPEGVERWHNLYQLDNVGGFGLGFQGVVRGHNDYIVAAGWIDSNDETERNGLVMKIEPEIVHPQFIYYEPEDTVFTVLQGDTVDFLVRVFDQLGNELCYLWTVGEDTIPSPQDTTITYCFSELGEYVVTCEVSNGEFVATINWRITAVEFYIVDFRPDSTELTIRRRSEIDFAIDVRANDLEGLGYYWDLVDRNGIRQEIGDTDSVRIQFDLTGDYDVEGGVWRDGNYDMAHWAVTVRSTVWGWFPEDTEMTVPFDTTMDFEVIPFNPASDSIGYFWTLNDEPLDVDTTVSLVTIEFPLINQETVHCLVRDGCEADSVIWLIDVVDPYNVALDPDDLLPESVSLSTPFPNPFNAATRIAYAVPSVGHVKLAVYDINGRMVEMLVDEDVPAGRHVCEFDGGELAAGLYFVRLVACGNVLTRKVVVVK